jgi:hypothetical protein
MQRIVQAVIVLAAIALADQSSGQQSITAFHFHNGNDLLENMTSNGLGQMRARSYVMGAADAQASFAAMGRVPKLCLPGGRLMIFSSLT